MQRFTFLKRKYLKYYFFLVILALVARCAYYGVDEAHFRLADDSRLPKWFVLPLGTSRDNVHVRITTRTTLFEGMNNVEFILMDNHDDTIDDVYGVMTTNFDVIDYASFPNYSLATINGITEVMEHKRQDDVLNVSDKREYIDIIKDKK